MNDDRNDNYQDVYDHNAESNQDISQPRRASKEATRAEKARARLAPSKKTPNTKMAISLAASLWGTCSLLKLIQMSTLEMVRVTTTLRRLRRTPVKEEYRTMKRPKTSKKTT